MTSLQGARPTTYSPLSYHPSRAKIPEEGNSSYSSSDHLFYFKSPLHHHAGVGGVVMQNGVRRATINRQNTPDAAVTTATAPSSATGGGAVQPNDGRSNDKKKGKFGGSSGRRIHKLGKRFSNILKRSSKKTLSEAQLRKRVRKAAERADWDAVRKMIANYEFSDIPEAMPKRGSFHAEQVAIPEEPASRRPSYGSRNGEGMRRSFTGSSRNGEGMRRSFTGKESAAAAAVIKAAMLDESSGPSGGSSSENRPDIGENILHDVCRFCPPLDVLEALLTALRNRRGSTFGTDDQGRTPLHLAADCGASSMIIDALVRTDPTPASIGDIDRRSPLHLAMRYLVNEGLHPLPHHHRGGRHHAAHERQLTPEEVIEQTLEIVQILKGAMLTYPGRIDFKDEDEAGYSPLDYALAEDIDDETLLQKLIRRKEPSGRRRSISSAHGLKSSRHSFRSSTSQLSGSTGNQDIEILEQLEQDEIDARRDRIRNIKEKEKKTKINYDLFDVFGIEEQPVVVASHYAPVAKPKSAQQEKSSPLKLSFKALKDEIKTEKKDGDSRDEHQKAEQRRSEEVIYNEHLEAYLDDFMEDFDGGNLQEHCDDDDDFDIFNDPDLEDPSPQVPKGMVDDAGNILPLMEITFHPNDNNDCVSVVSEVSTPL